MTWESCKEVNLNKGSNNNIIITVLPSPVMHRVVTYTSHPRTLSSKTHTIKKYSKKQFNGRSL